MSKKLTKMAFRDRACAHHAELQSGDLQAHSSCGGEFRSEGQQSMLRDFHVDPDPPLLRCKDSPDIREKKGER